MAEWQSVQIAVATMDHDKGRELFFLAQDARKSGRHAEAEAFLRAALRHAPGRESLRTNLCGALIDQGKHAEALGLCQDLIRDFPCSAVAWHRLSLCQFAARQPADALASVDRSLDLMANNVDALCHRIAIQLDLNDSDGALETGLRAVTLAPQDATVHTALGVVHTTLRQFEQTLECRVRALQLTPQDMDRRWNLALVQLMLGDLASGWHNMESRWSNAFPVKVRYSGTAPRWDGSSALQGRTILIWAEQGLGDVIQFSRFLPRLAQSGAQIIFQVPAVLGNLMSSLPAATNASIRVLAEGAPLPPHDWHLPLLSLPGCLAGEPAIPAAARLAPPPHRRDIWLKRLGERRRPRVGLMWQGNQGNLRSIASATP
jgi:Flp pilus assembly protein TadD